MASSPEYLQQLQAEKDNLDSSFVNAVRLISAGKERTAIIDEQVLHGVAMLGLAMPHAASSTHLLTNKGKTDSVERPGSELVYFIIL